MPDTNGGTITDSVIISDNVPQAIHTAASPTGQPRPNVYLVHGRRVTINQYSITGGVIPIDHAVKTVQEYTNLI